MNRRPCASAGGALNRQTSQEPSGASETPSWRPRKPQKRSGPPLGASRGSRKALGTAESPRTYGGASKALLGRAPEPGSPLEPLAASGEPPGARERGLNRQPCGSAGGALNRQTGWEPSGASETPYWSPRKPQKGPGTPLGASERLQESSRDLQRARGRLWQPRKPYWDPADARPRPRGGSTGATLTLTLTLDLSTGNSFFMKGTCGLKIEFTGGRRR